MRLLVLYQARNAALDHPGYFAGFERMVDDGQLQAHTPIAYLGVAAERGWAGLWDEAERAAKDADAVFLQFFHAPMPDPTEPIRRIQALPHRPLIFASCGDAFSRWSRPLPRSFRAVGRLAEASFITGMGHCARQLQSLGCKNLVLMPHGCCQVRFAAPGTVAETPEFDVCFIGSRVRTRNPFSVYAWAGRQRAVFVRAFTRRYGRRFGLFGHGWEGYQSWQGAISFLSQNETYQRSAIALGGMPQARHGLFYYLSDRPFIAAASGVPLVDYWVRGVDRILEPGREWWLARDLEEMLRLCDRLLDMPAAERWRFGAMAREQVLARHTQYHRCVEMVSIMKSVLEARRQNRRAPQPRLSFLGDSHEPGAPPEAIVNWCG